MPGEAPPGLKGSQERTFLILKCALLKPVLSYCDLIIISTTEERSSLSRWGLLFWLNLDLDCCQICHQLLWGSRMVH